MRYTCLPVGFPKTKVGNWKFPAIFSDMEVAEKFARDWYEDTFELPMSSVPSRYPGDEVTHMVESRDYDDEKIVAHMKDHITEDLKEVWETPRGYFVIREF